MKEAFIIQGRDETFFAKNGHRRIGLIDHLHLSI